MAAAKLATYHETLQPTERMGATFSFQTTSQVLEPLGFLRHFWRTEISTFTGSPVFLDFLQPINLRKWNR